MDDKHDQPQQPKLLHRDDVDMELVHQLEAEFAKTHPGAKVVFAGDSGIPPELAEQLQRFAEARERALAEGRCIDCGKVMPNWPPPEDENVEWDLADGWTYFKDLATGEPIAFQCPECDAAEPQVKVD